MDNRRSNFEYEDLLACGRGELFDTGPQLPLPPMLMFDRISEIAEVGGAYGKGWCGRCSISSRISGFSRATSRVIR